MRPWYQFHNDSFHLKALCDIDFSLTFDSIRWIHMLIEYLSRYYDGVCPYKGITLGIIAHRISLCHRLLAPVGMLSGVSFRSRCCHQSNNMPIWYSSGKVNDLWKLVVAFRVYSYCLLNRSKLGDRYEIYTSIKTIYWLILYLIRTKAVCNHFCNINAVY